MTRAPAGRRRQQGAGLLVLAAALVLGVATILVVRVNEIGTRSIADHRRHNAAVLEHAKRALIGHVAMKAAEAGENNPGRLPCPESPNDAGTADEGRAGSSCAPGFPTNKNVGRLPWRTLGVDKLLDAKAEPLWYAVSPGWVYAGANLVINSNTLSQLTVDGEANTVVAVIIAPDVAMNVQASPGCSAQNQARSAPAPGINPVNYVECFNSATLTSFATSGPASSFNDQVLKVTVADLLPAIEAAIAARFEREIAARIRSAYSNGDAANPNPAWPATLALPFAAAFADPTTSAFKGSAASTAGLLPMTYSETSPGSGTACNPGTDGPRCDPTFVSWSGASLSGASVYSANCTATTATQVNCTFYRRCTPVFIIFCAAANVPFTLTATAANAGMALRQLNNAASMTNVNAAPRTSSGVLNNDGSATITLNGEASAPGGLGFGGVLGNVLCGLLGGLLCREESIAVSIRLLADHPLLSTSHATTGWFVRNKWHEAAYYAPAPGVVPSGPRTCTGSPGCLTVNLHPSATPKRGVLVLAGRSLSGTARPNGTLTDWLEDANCDFNGTTCVPNTTYTARAPTLYFNRTFNDRIAVIDAEP